MSQQPLISKIEFTDLHILKSILHPPSRDPYASSPAYYGLTGRKGLWLYELNDSFLIFCVHPNLTSERLVFPPYGRNANTLLIRFFSDPRIAGHSYSLARLETLNAESVTAQLNQGIPDFTFKTTKEKILDWIYPVHILDTKTVAVHAGHKFRDFRKNIYRAQRLNPEVLPLDINVHLPSLTTTVQAWAKTHCSENWSDDALEEPYTFLFNMVQKSGLNFGGFIVRINDEIRGFTIWEIPSDNKQVVSSLASCTDDRHQKGIAEFQYFKMCQNLLEDGFKSVCIGGSETLGLDSFKRKMNPHSSIDLTTLTYDHLTRNRNNGDQHPFTKEKKLLKSSNSLDP